MLILGLVIGFATTRMTSNLSLFSSCSSLFNPHSAHIYLNRCIAPASVRHGLAGAFNAHVASLPAAALASIYTVALATNVKDGAARASEVEAPPSTVVTTTTPVHAAESGAHAETPVTQTTCGVVGEGWARRLK